MIGAKQRGEQVFIILLIIVPLIAAIWTFRDYGESVDENSNYVYANQALSAYRAIWAGDFHTNAGKGIIHYYGPAFIMGADLFSGLLNTWSRGSVGTTGWHLAYFLSFQIGVVGLFLLAKRWLSTFAAIGTSLLFLFQPLLWGHAFINPKDIPFMTFFLLCILAGLHMRDKLWPVPVELQALPLSSAFREWQASAWSARAAAILLLLLGLVLFAFSLTGYALLLRIVSFATATIFGAKPDSLVLKAVAMIAPNYRQITPELYVSKGIKLAKGALDVSALALVVMACILFRRLLTRTLAPASNAALVRVGKDAIGSLGNPVVLLAGITLGLATSIRVVGPFAGLIVLILLARAGKFKAFSPALAFIAVAAVVTYLSWPYLWSDPINRFAASLSVMSDFPRAGKILFNGAFYTSRQLPLSYVPVLFGVQFTEPFVALFVVGLCWLIYECLKRTCNPEFALVVILWGIVPVMIFTIWRTSLYDNFRQILFVVPPLFLIAGLALDRLVLFLRNSLVRAVFIALVILGGIYQIVHLHPYEYVYYNVLAGGLRGAYQHFESDYLGTSSREAMAFLNGIAPLHSHVIIYTAGSHKGASRFARADLIVDTASHPNPDSAGEYAIVNTRGQRALKRFMRWKVLYTIGREGNIFAFVKQGP